MKKVYRVTLSEEERKQLQALVQKGKAESGRKPSALKLTRARILLKADQSADSGPAWTDAQIAEAVEVSAKTVFNIRKKWVELGIKHVLNDDRKNGRPACQSWTEGLKQKSLRPVAARLRKDEADGRCGCLPTKRSNSESRNRSARKPFARRSKKRRQAVAD